MLIIASKLQRLEREVGELVELARERDSRRCSSALLAGADRLRRGGARLLLAALHPARRPGACASAGSPRPRCSPCRRPAPTASRGRRWAGSLNLFVWLVVGDVPHLGLPAALPAARARGDAARGRALPRRRASAAARRPASAPSYGNLFLVAARRASCSRPSPASRSRRRSPALYLLRGAAAAARARRHPAPAAAVARRARARDPADDRDLAAAADASASIAGFVRLRQHGGGVDALMAATILTWLVYAVFLAVRPTGRRAAYVALARLRLRDPRPDRARREPLLKLSLVGISHHVAPVELRERVALPLERAASLARALGDAVCLSTCNRTEVYLADQDDGARARVAREARGRAARSPSPTGCTTRPPPSTSSASRPGSTRSIPGESEILGQVRAAFDAAAPGPLLDRVFRQALQLGKRVRTETAIGESPASVPSAAAALAEQVFGDLDGRRVLLVGAGPDRRARRRQPLGARRLDRLRREPQRRGRAPTSRRASARRRSRSTRSRTSSARSTSCSPRRARRGSSSGRRTCRRRRRQPLFFIDIAVPRDVDPVGARARRLLPLRHRRPRGRRGRDASPAGASRRSSAEQLVAEEAERFREWQASLDVVPAIASLRAYAEEIRADGARQARRCPSTSGARSSR